VERLGITQAFARTLAANYFAGEVFSSGGSRQWGFRRGHGLSCRRISAKYFRGGCTRCYDAKRDSQTDWWYDQSSFPDLRDRSGEVS